MAFDTKGLTLSTETKGAPRSLKIQAARGIRELEWKCDVICTLTVFLPSGKNTSAPLTSVSQVLSMCFRWDAVRSARNGASHMIKPIHFLLHVLVSCKFCFCPPNILNELFTSCHVGVRRGQLSMHATCGQMIDQTTKWDEVHSKEGHIYLKEQSAVACACRA